MKRIISLFVVFVMTISLFGCGIIPRSTDRQNSYGDAPTVTLPDGSVVYSQEPKVEFPQTGEYKETALLTNVPGQGIPLLLDVRSDGTVDYIFADTDDPLDFQSFVENGTCYYTISPDGKGTKQSAEWMAELDAYLVQAVQAVNEGNGKWFFRFAAEDGILLILAQYCNAYEQTGDKNGMYSTLGSFLHSVLFKIENNVLSIVPIEWEVFSEDHFDLGKKYIDKIMMESGFILFTANSFQGMLCTDWITTYHMDGSLVDIVDLNTQDDPMEALYELDISVDADGKITYTKEVPDRGNSWLVYPTHGVWNAKRSDQYTDDDTLYALGKYRANYEVSELRTQAIAYGEDGTFYQWFNELGQGVLMQYQHNPEGAIDPEIVTVWSWEHIDLIETAVAQWNHTHASPIFRYETAESQLDTSGLTTEEIEAQEESYRTRLNLELANGQGADVMILDGLNVDSLMEFMAPLDQVNTAGVYDNLVMRFTESGDLLAVPARMNPYLLGRTGADTQAIGSLKEFADLVTTSTGVLDMYHTDAYRSFNAQYNVYEACQVFQLWYPAWADAIWENGRLQKDVYVDFLEETDRLVQHYALYCDNLHLNHETNHDISSIINATEDNMFASASSRLFPYTLAATDHVGLFTYWRYENDDGNVSDPIPCILDGIPGPDGTGAMVPKVIAGVREGGNEEAGQEFIQLLLSREMQLGTSYYNPNDADGYPVKWSYTEELLQRTGEYMHQQFAPQNDYQATLNELRTVVIDETLYNAALYAALCCYRGEPGEGDLVHDTKSLMPLPEEIKDMVSSIDWEPTTPEEAADLLDDLTRIYLAEQAR